MSSGQFSCQNYNFLSACEASGFRMSRGEFPCQNYNFLSVRKASGFRMSRAERERAREANTKPVNWTYGCKNRGTLCQTGKFHSSH